MSPEGEDRKSEDLERLRSRLRSQVGPAPRSKILKESLKEREQLKKLDEELKEIFEE